MKLKIERYQDFYIQLVSENFRITTYFGRHMLFEIISYDNRNRIDSAKCWQLGIVSNFELRSFPPEMGSSLLWQS